MDLFVGPNTEIVAATEEGVNILFGSGRQNGNVGREAQDQEFDRDDGYTVAGCEFDDAAESAAGEGRMKFRRLPLVLTIAGLALSALPGAVPQAFSGVGININIGPPPVVVAEPPEVVLIPDSKVYYVPDPEVDIFFYSGYWYSPRGNRWYRARAYNGPWVLVGRRHVPVQVIRVPRDYREVYEDEEHIPYGQWKKQWRHRHGHDHDDDDDD